jgi:DNA-binding IclR family transcriptional regulator
LEVILRARRKLTDRQVAVLAAVERLGEPTLPEIAAGFDSLSPSAVLRVLEALAMRGVIEWRGDMRWVYLGDVAADVMVDDAAVVRFRAASIPR